MNDPVPTADHKIRGSAHTELVRAPERLRAQRKSACPVAVAYKTRTQQRNINGETIRDQAEEDDFDVEKLADEYAARAQVLSVI